jgi:hypothetical protein
MHLTEAPKKIEEVLSTPENIDTKPGVLNENDCIDESSEKEDLSFES